MDLTDEQADILAKWARATPQVRALYLFGSRARGTSTSDSDCDLALRFTVADELVEALFMYHHDEWFLQLRAATGLPVTLHHLAGHHTPKHEAYVADCNVELYRRY